MIDLGKGHPSTCLLATKEFAAASSSFYSRIGSVPEDFSDDDRHPLQYGTDAGPLSVRTAFAGWFSRIYGLPSCDPNLLAVTCGASFGLANTCLQFTDVSYTRRIFMVTPAYFLAARIFQDAGFTDKMFAIDEQDGDGLDLQQLQRVLENDDEHEDQWPSKTTMGGRRFKYLLYAVPTFSNPTGVTTSLQKRIRLLELARKHDILLITDEVYDFLDYSESQENVKRPDRPIPRLVDLDLRSILSPESSIEVGNTISNMSFSKYLGPGLRIGILQASSKALADQWSSGGANHSGGMMAQQTSYIVAEMIEDGSMDAVISNLKVVYSDRSRTIRETIAKEFPKGTVVSGGAGGYFIWVELPSSACTNSTAAEILEIARTEKYGVHAMPGSAFEVPGHERGWGRRFMRISLSYSDKSAAQDGIRILARVLRDSLAL